MLKTNNSAIRIFLFSLVTFGIYGLFFLHRVAKETNQICQGDRRKTGGLLAFIILGIITFGIYVLVWKFKILSRRRLFLEKNGRKGVASQTVYLLWALLFFPVAPIYFYFKGTWQHNAICEVYNQLKK
ncbi:DUF4234 domain-containing protein [Mycoplasma crocodyli]|uniref:DUF4234 domain-containing protein n=1 Tax=Mycoplasma crocodyli (strain ATCC 51981 / MP145) TaxID=512564 RepID=D5E4M6_MYCCM|nr:DUF4234 domain-containing protein [Mycoplasma crocodyli]ADE19611.1 hypothetical protein MCRO_0035 [Mycoplasma crocodyli MP145]